MTVFADRDHHDVVSVLDHAAHTPFSTPGRHAALVDVLDPSPAAVSVVARNLVVHYRASGLELPEETRDDIHSRWFESILDRDQERHARPLTDDRQGTTRVQGCCRDHTLVSVGILRQHGVPARSRIGFAGYFVDGWHHDHVVVEWWDPSGAGGAPSAEPRTPGRWVRFDPEVADPSAAIPDPLDIASGPGAPFETAAEVWRGMRSGDLDGSTYGVDVTLPEIGGEWFVRNYVILEVAHRFGDETLLWDGWGAMVAPGEDHPDEDRDRLVDGVADLLVSADAGDPVAEARLLDRYREDARLRPGATVRRGSPLGSEVVVVDLSRGPRRRP